MKNGEIVHYELPAKNPAKLSKFYANVLGWAFKDSGMVDMKYWTIKTSSSQKMGFGGMYKKTMSQQVPTSYVSVANIDATVKKIQKSGGKVLVPKQAIPKMGWSVVARDPEGNALGLFQMDVKAGMPKKK